MPILRRRAVRVAARCAALLAVVAAPSARAEAQAQCDVGTLADYLALGATGCRIGRVTFANFALVNDVLASTNVTIVTPDLASLVVPFRGGGNIFGHPGFGFDFEGLYNDVSAATSTASVDGDVRTTFQFTLSSTARELQRAFLYGATVIDKVQTPGQIAALASLTADVGDGTVSCLDVDVSRTQTGNLFERQDPCAPDEIQTATATYVFESRLARDRGRQFIEGTVQSGLISAGFRASAVEATLATPEPATLVLTAAGLVLTGAVARRRSRSV